MQLSSKCESNCLNDYPYLGEACDIFSLGCIVTGSVYQNLKQDGNVIIKELQLSEELKELITCLLAVDANDIPSIDEIKKINWVISGYNHYLKGN